jgi:hypothetical protein
MTLKCLTEATDITSNNGINKETHAKLHSRIPFEILIWEEIENTEPISTENISITTTFRAACTAVTCSPPAI